MFKLALFALLLITIGGVGLHVLNNRTNTEPLGTAYPQGTQFSQEVGTTDLAEATGTAVVVLRDGDSYDLTASIVKKMLGNREVKMLAYNGMIPGPVLQVPQGGTVTLHFTNNTDVDTTIHSHGVRLDNAFDGVPDVTQQAVKPGESFTYTVTFPDAGLYWYHPHIREDYAQELGLYGTYLVEPSDPTYWSPVNRELPLTLDDILIENGVIAPFSTVGADHTLMGRYGNTMLINGETDYRLEAQTGEVMRLYLTNVANTRTFNVSLPGVRMKLVGGDSGKYERETWVDAVVLAPSERVIVDVQFAQPGMYTLTHTTPERTYPLARISVAGESIEPSYTQTFETLRTNADVITEIDALRPYFDRPVDKQLRLTIGMGGAIQGMMRASENGGGGSHMMRGGDAMQNSMMVNSNEPIEWEDVLSGMNARSTSDMLTWILEDLDTGKQNGDINSWRFTVGDKVKVKITNDERSMHPMQHPIHFHGQRFLVLSTDGKQNDNMVWKDTVLVPNGSTVEILIDMTNPGTWMAHCHIAEHLEAGMMFSFVVAQSGN